MKEVKEKQLQLICNAKQEEKRLLKQQHENLLAANSPQILGIKKEIKGERAFIMHQNEHRTKMQ